MSLGSGDVPDARFKTAGERRRREKKRRKLLEMAKLPAS